MQPTRVRDLEDPRLDPFRVVADPTLIRERGLFVAEGRRVVERLLRATPGAVRALLLTETALDALGDALAAAGGDRAPVYVVEGPADVRRLTGHRFHQGCLALADRPAAREVGDVVGRGAADGRTVLGLERVTDPDNVGALFRSAAAFSAEAIVLSPGCAHPLYRKALRNSLGTALTLPFAEPAVWGEGLDVLRAHGYVLWALTPDPGARDLVALAQAPPPRVALLLGSEADGLTADTLARADERVRIGIDRAVDSLNVAAAGAVALHALHAARRAS